MSNGSLIILGWLVMSLVMAILWFVQRRTGDAGIVDVAWGLGVAALGSVFAWNGSGLRERQLLGAILISVWAIRLSGYILVRVLTLPEDGRYRQLKSQWGEQAQAKMFRFYQLQAFGSLLFALPLLLVGQNAAALNLWDAIAIAVWLIAILGEAIADRQLALFRQDPQNRGQVCRAGLWRYSRHPNYFFEWLHWWTYVLLALYAPLGWLTLLGPLAMYYFIRYVTGIPPTEAQALLSRGNAYRDYQRTTSPFFPWFPQESPPSK